MYGTASFKNKNTVDTKTSANFQPIRAQTRQDLISIFEHQALGIVDVMKKIKWTGNMVELIQTNEKSSPKCNDLCLQWLI